MKYRNKCILFAQKIIRGYLARKKHQPRFKGIMKIKQIKASLAQAKEIANQLKTGKEIILKQVNELEVLIENSVRKIKVIPKFEFSFLNFLFLFFF